MVTDADDSFQYSPVSPFDAKANRFDRLIGDLWASKDPSHKNYGESSDIKKDCKSTNHQPVITKASNSGSLLGEGGLSSAPVATFAPMPSSPLEPDSSNSIQRQAKPSIEIKSSDNQTASQSTAMFSHLAVQKSPQGNSGNDTFLASFPQGLENHSNYATSTFGQHFSPFSQVNSPDSIGNAASPSSWAHSASPTSSSGEIAPYSFDSYMDIKIENVDNYCSKSLPKKTNRPGRKAKRADSTLSKMELAKRELRRERNKEAARRCRQRRLDKTRNLEDQVNELQIENGHLMFDNERLRKQIEHLRYLLGSYSNNSPPISSHPSHIDPISSHSHKSHPNLLTGNFSPSTSGHLPNGPVYHQTVNHAVNHSALPVNQQSHLGRLVSKTASGARKEISFEKKEQTIFMNL